MNQTNKEETAVKFEELISKSRERKKICTNSTDEIYQDVLNFVSNNIKIDQVIEEIPSDKGDYIGKLRKRLEDCHEFAQIRMRVATDRMKRRYDVGTTRDVFEKGDAVWLYNPQRRKGLSPKTDVRLGWSICVESCMAQFQSISSAVSAPLSLVASQAIAQQLSGLAVLNSNNEAKNCHLLDENVKIKALLLLDLIKKMIAKNSFDKVNFVKCLASKDIPMELVWLLNEESLVSFRSCLLSWYEDENWIDYFCVGVRILCCDECLDTADLRQNIVQLIIGDLLHMTYGETELPQKKAKKILFKAMDHVEKEVGKSSSDQSKNWLCLYKVICDISDIPANTIHTFFHEMFSELLERPCSLTVEEAIACQETWTYECLSEATIMKYQQFIVVFRNEEVVQIFERAVDSMKCFQLEVGNFFFAVQAVTEAVNIQVLSHLLTVFLVFVEDAYKLFDDFLGRCISETFENCDLLQLCVVLLFRRQAALEGNHVSPSYSTWFEKTFVTKGLSLGLNTKRTIQFFFKTLSDLVPYEKPEYLKVHIFKSLHVPIKYRYFVDDYVSLAKTRLADLNEPLEDNAGIFRQGHGNLNDEQVKVMEQAKVDVDKVLKLYEESGKVPTTIMEASIFRKPYFIGRFLPALLIPRTPPSEADVRARLIDDLNRAGKIPDSMLRSYHKKCDKFEDSSSSDTPRDNVQKLVDNLEKLPTLVLDEITGVEAATKGLTSWLSVISRKIKLIFTPNVHDTISEVIDLDLASLNVKDDHVQASYEIMNAFCRTCAAVQNVRISESLASNREIVKFRWASRFVSMLLSIPRLIESLYVHLWSTVSHEPHLLQDEHIYGLIILVCHLACSKSGLSSIIRLQSTTVAESEYYQSFVDLLSNQIPLISRSSTNFFIRWCCCYLQYAVVAFDIVTTNANQVTADSLAGSCYVPEIMVIKMQYLFNKLKFRKHEFKDRVLDEKTWDVLKLVMKSLHDIGLLQDLSHVGFKQWLVWELRIEEDFLLENERQQYYNWAIYEQFIPSCNRDEGDSSVTYRETASQLFAVLMDHYSSSREIGMNRVQCSTETNLLKILQDIVCLIGHTHAHGSTDNSKEVTENIWLLDCFISRNKEVNVSGNSSKDLQLCCEIMAFLRLATLLPPWLLTANSEWDFLYEQSTKKLVSFLNNYLKPYMFQETFAFPFDFTAHLLKAFFSSSLKPGTENVRTSEKLFRQLTKGTPLFFGSFVHYWKQLKPLCHRYIAQSDVLKQFQSYHLWLNSVFDTKERSHGVTLPEDTGDEPGFAFGIFLYLKRRLHGITSRLVSEISDFSSREFTHAQTFGSGVASTRPRGSASFNSATGCRMTKLLDSLLDTLPGKKIILYLYDNIMSYLVDVIFQGNQIKDEELWVEISMEILSRCPDVLRVFTQGLQEDSELTTVRSLLASKHFCKLLPVIFFRIIVQQPKRKLHQILFCEASIQAMLIMYIDCSNIYKECAEISYSLSRSKPLDLEFFVEVTRFIKDYLNIVPHTILRTVPEHLIKRSSLDIQRFFSR